MVATGRALEKVSDQMRGRIWIITELYYPEQTSTGYLLTKLAEGLARSMPVSVICNQPTYSARGLRAPRSESHNGVHIRRCRATTLSKDVLLFRLLNLITFTISVFLAATCNIHRGDRVLVVTNPPTLPFAVAFACRVRRAKCLLLIHDVYPELMVPAGFAKSGSFFYKVIGWMTQALYESVQTIIVLGRDMHHLVARKLSKNRRNVVIIPNWADVDQVTPTERTDNVLLVELGLTNKFVVQYSGNMGRTHDVESLLESAEKLKANPDVHFVFIGSGVKKAMLQRFVKDKDLSNVRVLAERPRGDLGISLNACDVAVIAFVRGMSGISVPCRLYNVMAAGKPIIAIADDDSELARVVREEGIGWVVAPQHPDGIFAAIRDAASDRGRLAEMGKRARRAAESKYTFSHVLDAYRRVLEEGDGSEDA